MARVVRLPAISYLVAVSGLLSLCCGQQDVPHNSTVIVPERKSYAVFHNVLLQEEGILFYLPDELADGPVDALHQPPNLRNLLSAQWWSLPGHWKVEIVSRHNSSQFHQKCNAWIEQPALLFAGMPVDHKNPYHFFCDNMMRVFATLADQGLLDVAASTARDHEPNSTEANLVILQTHVESWTSKFHELFDHMTPNQWSFPHGAGFCYRTLVVGADNDVQTYNLAPNIWSQAWRTHHQRQFSRWAIAKQLMIDDARGRTIERPPASNGRLQIRLVSRPSSAWSSRAITNEQELVAAIRAKYGNIADVQTISFNGSLSTAMLAMNSTDVLIGMHGAGLTNILWMRPGGAVVQLIPYGWHRRHEDFPYLAVLFEQLSHNANVSHFLWENNRTEHSFLGKRHHEGEVRRYGKEEEDMHDWQEHPEQGWVAANRQYRPNTNEMYAHWMYQDTHVDVTTFMPVLDQAVAAVRPTGPARGR
ncbi:hypothetical protein WJX73_007577 [Symbiochloris irregularis]|uniref:Glycosyltransferase 61 catalytic domain-containing protein n=1 Tax=Symbiochloris irregularis TaxID=706552 RepID=A0AAW1P7Q1_9CHLO